MTDSSRNTGVHVPNKSALFFVAVGVAVALCITCCTLILSIPTESITVDTVYQGF